MCTWEQPGDKISKLHVLNILIIIIVILWYVDWYSSKVCMSRSREGRGDQRMSPELLNKLFSWSCAGFISGFHSREGKHIVANFKGGGGGKSNSKRGQQHIKYRRGGESTPCPPSPEINPDVCRVMSIITIIVSYKVILLRRFSSQIITLHNLNMLDMFIVILYLIHCTGEVVNSFHYYQGDSVVKTINL